MSYVELNVDVAGMGFRGIIHHPAFICPKEIEQLLPFQFIVHAILLVREVRIPQKAQCLPESRMKVLIQFQMIQCIDNHNR